MFNTKLVYKSDDEEYIENESNHLTLDDAFYEANEVAFSTTGFNLETWKHVASFGEDGGLFYFYPIDGNRAVKYVMRVLKFR